MSDTNSSSSSSSNDQPADTSNDVETSTSVASVDVGKKRKGRWSDDDDTTAATSGNADETVVTGVDEEVARNKKPSTDEGSAGPASDKVEEQTTSEGDDKATVASSADVDGYVPTSVAETINNHSNTATTNSNISSSGNNNNSNIQISTSSSSSLSYYGNAATLGKPEMFQLEMRVPNNMCGYIIGKQGDNIQRMQIQTGATIKLQQENEMKPGETQRLVMIKGPTQESVQNMNNKVNDIVAMRLAMASNGGLRGSSSGGSNIGVGYGMQQQQQQHSELHHAFVIKIPVPNDKIGLVIGKGGMNVKGIQERTKARLLIPQGPDEENPNIRTISIGSDTKEAAELAQMEIFLILQQQNVAVIQQTLVTTSVLHISIPDERVGIIIGKGGSTIKEIQQRTQCKVNIPQIADPGSNPPVRTLSIIGSVEGQNCARYEIEVILQGAAQGNTAAALAAAAAATNAAMHGGGGQYNQYGSAYGQQPAASHYQANANASYYGAAAGGMQQQQYGAYGQQQQQAAQYGSYYGAQQAATYDNNSTSAASAVDPSDPTAYYNDFWQYAAYYGEAAARLYYTTWSPPEGTQPPQGVIVPGGVATNNVVAATATATATSSSDSNAQKEYDEYLAKYREWWLAHGKAAGAPETPAV